MTEFTEEQKVEIDRIVNIKINIFIESMQNRLAVDADWERCEAKYLKKQNDPRLNRRARLHRSNSAMLLKLQDVVAQGYKFISKADYGRQEESNEEFKE